MLFNLFLLLLLGQWVLILWLIGWKLTVTLILIYLLIVIYLEE